MCADPSEFTYSVSPALYEGDSFSGKLSRITGEALELANYYWYIK